MPAPHVCKHEETGLIITNSKSKFMNLNKCNHEDMFYLNYSLNHSFY